MALTLAACSAGNGSAGNGGAGEPDNVGGDAAVHIVDVAELDATVHPDGYPLIVASDFDAGGEIFKYFGWYSEDDRSVLITIKVEGDTLKYYAYSARGIS